MPLQTIDQYTCNNIAGGSYINDVNAHIENALMNCKSRVGDINLLAVTIRDNLDWWGIKRRSESVQKAWYEAAIAEIDDIDSKYCQGAYPKN